MNTAVRYAPLGFNQIGNTALASAVGLGKGLAGDAVPAGANMALISPVGQAVVFRDDGFAPDGTTGITIPAGTFFEYSGNLSAVQITRATSGATLNVSFYSIRG